MENGPFIDDFPIKPSIYKGFSMAMLNNQMVIILMVQPLTETDFGPAPGPWDRQRWHYTPARRRLTKIGYNEEFDVKMYLMKLYEYIW